MPARRPAEGKASRRVDMRGRACSGGPSSSLRQAERRMLDAMSDLVRVATVESEPEADLAVGLLRTEGINAMWQRSGDSAAGMGIGPVGGIGGLFDVVVLPEDAERAQELLAESESGDDLTAA